MPEPKKRQYTPPRKWVKLWVIDCLEGSIRWQLNSEGRGVWYDLIVFAALGSPPGVIADKDGRPYPHSFIANRLNIPPDLLETTLNKCKEEGRISENDTGIHIVNWPKYQSEYDRQKPYRQKKLNEKAAAIFEQLKSCFPDAFGHEPDSRETSQLRDLAIGISGASPTEKQLRDAFKEAAMQNKLSIAYIRAILVDWLELT